MKFQSSLITAASGSVNGSTYSTNRYGMYIRAKGNPVNPNTARQAAVRADFATLADYWSLTLTQIQRDGWNAYGNAVEVQGKFGVPQFIPGFNHFLRSNALRLQVGQSIIVAAPGNMNLGNPVTSITSVILAAGEIAILAPIAGLASTNGDYTVSIGNIMPAGKVFYGGPFQLAGTGEITTNDPSLAFTAVIATPAEWLTNKPVAVGYRIPIRLSIQYDDGRRPHVYQEVRAITAA